MLAFVDEAGDAGMKLGGGPSTHFLIALVTFVDHDEALRCDHRIAALRRDLGLADSFEFHFAQNSRGSGWPFWRPSRPSTFDTTCSR